MQQVLSANRFRIESPCTLAAAREATRKVHAFLVEQGANKELLFACELALVEACNNAVQHAPATRRGDAILIEAICSSESIELRVTDRTAGFDLPDSIPQPEADIERGRGLFLIRSMMDEVTYERGPASNVLRMVKRRA